MADALDVSAYRLMLTQYESKFEYTKYSTAIYEARAMLYIVTLVYLLLGMTVVSRKRQVTISTRTLLSLQSALVSLTSLAVIIRLSEDLVRTFYLTLSLNETLCHRPLDNVTGFWIFVAIVNHVIMGFDIFLRYAGGNPNSMFILTHHALSIFMYPYFFAHQVPYLPAAVLNNSIAVFSGQLCLLLRYTNLISSRTRMICISGTIGLESIVILFIFVYSVLNQASCPIDGHITVTCLGGFLIFLGGSFLSRHGNEYLELVHTADKVSKKCL
ncbi:hypothetical protein HDE_04160 [Halotydeus destructor]|nr:hypothetical protein HDE_04160 [Halotydeus destructor]